MRIDPIQAIGYKSRGFRKIGSIPSRGKGLTTRELENFESFVLGWWRQQEEMGFDITRMEFRELIEGVREQPLSDLEFSIFLDYFKDWHSIEIPD